MSSANPEHPLPMPTENCNSSRAIPTSIEMDENRRKPVVEGEIWGIPYLHCRPDTTKSSITSLHELSDAQYLDG